MNRLNAMPATLANGDVAQEAPDVVLLAGARSGDERAFEALFFRHYPAVYAVVLRIVGDLSDAEEIVGDTFLKLHRDRTMSAGDDGVRGWLIRVATNAAFNTVRSRRRRFEWLRRLGQRRDMRGDGDADPLDIAIERDTAAAVREHLATLPERQRMVLTMRYSGFSYAEIAEVAGMSAGSVGTTLARAEKALRASLESAGVQGRQP